MLDVAGAIEAFMAANPEPWRGHPETCKWHPRPNLVTVHRRGGFLWLKLFIGGNCTGCDWRVEGAQWVAVTNWNNFKRAEVLNPWTLEGATMSDPRKTVHCRWCGKRIFIVKGRYGSSWAHEETWRRECEPWHMAEPTPLGPDGGPADGN